jgi:phosphatidylethanolamine-binding protein (PEBP) family uncharacterized protein
MTQILHSALSVGWSTTSLTRCVRFPGEPLRRKHSLSEQPKDLARQAPAATRAPAPGAEPHRYVIRVYALVTDAALAPGMSKQLLASAVKGHVLPESQWSGVFGGENP